MNWCEGLTLRSGNTACKDWQAAIDQKKITPPFIFIKEQMISTRKASSPAESRRNSPGFQVFNIENVLHNLRRSHGAARRVGFAGCGYCICETDPRERNKNMKTKRLVFISCLTAAALMASPALSQTPQRKPMVSSSSHRTVTSGRMATTMPRSSTPRTVTSGRAGFTTQNRTFTNNQFVFDTFGSFYPYGYYPCYGYYPYSYYSDYYPYNYSYYTGSAYGYDASTVAAVQRRLGELGFYHGVVDGVMGPLTRAAIRAYEATHHLVVDGTISGSLLETMGLS